MRTIIFCFLCISIIASKVNGQDSNQLNTIQSGVDTIAKQIKTINNKIDSVKQQTVFNYFDSSSYAFAKNNPATVIYKNCIFLNTAKTQKTVHPKWDAYLRFWLCLVIALLILFYAIRLARTTTLIRDEVYNTVGTLVTKDIPYSYSRTQLLWWSVIIMVCYTLLFGITGVLVPLNGTMVLLLGLGASVYGFARLIDDNQVTSLAPGTRHQEKEGTKHFLKDILSDDIGISIHRMQSFIFNIIFGLGFIFYFIQSLRSGDYPFIEMEQWQFALLGISASTYLGIKATAENKKANPATT
jgi:hypothetical protein